MTAKTVIHQYDSKGNRIGVFESTKMMAIETGYSASAIRQCCTGDKLSVGGTICLLKHKWTKETEQTEVLRRISLMTEADKQPEPLKTVVCFNVRLEITEFPSIYSASEVLGLRLMDIKRNCEGSAFTLRDYCFYYKEELPTDILPFIRSVQAKFFVWKQSQQRQEIARNDKAMKNTTKSG